MRKDNCLNRLCSSLLQKEWNGKEEGVRLFCGSVVSVCRTGGGPPSNMLDASSRILFFTSSSKKPLYASSVRSVMGRFLCIQRGKILPSVKYRGMSVRCGPLFQFWDEWQCCSFTLPFIVFKRVGL